MTIKFTSLNCMTIYCHEKAYLYKPSNKSLLKLNKMNIYNKAPCLRVDCEPPKTKLHSLNHFYTFEKPLFILFKKRPEL